jgi:tRNA-Thr(GGU) m(6)t(6)A37 methyltransferase TsaA
MARHVLLRGDMNRSITSAGLAALVALAPGAPGAEERSAEAESFTLRPVGRVHKHGSRATIEIAPRYRDALLGLEGFSHVWVLWWFDRNDTPEKRNVLRVHPRGNPKNPLTGVFATRSPARPNLIGMTLCRITSVEGTGVRVDHIDAFDNTPVLDLKPHIPDSDGDRAALVPPWVRGE